MNYLNREVAAEGGFLTAQYGGGEWIAYHQEPDGSVIRITIFDNEDDALRSAVVTERSVAYVPYGVDIESYVNRDLDNPKQ